MKKSLNLILLLMVLACTCSAEILFVENDKPSLDFNGIVSNYRDGTTFSVGYGLNNKLGFKLNAAHAAYDNGLDVQVYAPEIDYYLIKPSPNAPLFLSVLGKYLYSQMTGSASADMSGFQLGGNLGLKFSRIRDLSIYPYLGLIYEIYTIRNVITGGSPSPDIQIDRAIPKLGAYLGLSVGPGDVLYFTPNLIFVGEKVYYHAELGYHYAVR